AKPLDQSDDAEKGHAADAEDDERGKDARGVQLLRILGDEVTDALTGADPFADRGADNGEGRGDLEPAEDIGEGDRKAQLEEGLQAGRLERAEEIDELRFEALQAGDDRDGQREEGDDGGDGDARRTVVAEPNDQYRGDGDHRNSLRGDDQGEDA